MEYFCTQGDDLWKLSDEELTDLATRELIQLKLWDGRGAPEGVVFRQTSHPVYNLSYKQHLAVIQRYLKPFGNLQTISRSGTYRYNNMDHAMISGFLGGPASDGGTSRPDNLSSAPLSPERL